MSSTTRFWFTAFFCAALFITIAFNTIDAILWFWSRDWLRLMCDMSNKEIIKMRFFFLSFDQHIKVYTMCIILLYKKSDTRWNFSNLVLCTDCVLNWLSIRKSNISWIEIFFKEKNDTNKKIGVFIIQVMHKQN